jgi:hypothetical protein
VPGVLGTSRGTLKKRKLKQFKSKGDKMDREYIYVLTVCDTETMENERTISLGGKNRKVRFREICEDPDTIVLEANVWPAKKAGALENPGMEKFKS